jgi:short-subunit dehydrogenase
VTASAQSGAGRQLWSRALVTGASSGIGEAIAERLASSGVAVVVVGRSAALDAVAERIARAGGQVQAVKADLSVEEDVERVASLVRTAVPAIDLLVNNAGVGQHGAFADLPIAGAIETIRVNDEALVRLTHAAISPMVAAGHGCVINISSTAALNPGPSQAVYSASKAFVSSFGRALADELRGTGVTCTTVLPGYTRTRYFERVGLSPNIPETHWMSADQVAALSIDAARAGQRFVIIRHPRGWELAMSRRFPALVADPIGSHVRRIARVVERARRRILH